ncbi:MAG: bifunctional folylpolyglutamate synthase/dihydrofolate synthase [Clostridiales bacterium]|nr:bifunctional folylpolyglutamate synthase/dihydrofolate synthase [Clostridiales bacterium]
MNYDEAIEYIHSIPKFIRPLGNVKLAALLKALGNPQDKLKFVHIAGTNGKGSAAAMLSAMLTAQGYKTGMYTSPFIEVFNERIQINGENIPDERLAALTERVRDAMGENQVSEFAFITAAAFLYFYEEGCDWVVAEAGMGGRLDATNIIKKPAVSVIMSISLDHMQYLGNTVEEIAREKCGIIKEGCPVVSYPNFEVRDIIKSSAKAKAAPLIFAGVPTRAEGGFIYGGREYALSLAGAYQPQNAAVAIEAARVIGICENAVYEGLKNVRWPARFEYIADNIVIDGAHNIDGIKELVKCLDQTGRRIVILAAMMEDKACEECMSILSGAADKIITTQLSMPRCISDKGLAKYCGGEAAGEPKAALERALEIAGEDGLVCVCGSLYLAGEIKRLKKVCAGTVKAFSLSPGE